MTDAQAAVADHWRQESATIVATLVRMVGDVGLAEELAQDALVAALEQWPRTGIPDEPGAWLTTVARRRAVDHLRRTGRLEALGDDPGPESAAAGDEITVTDGPFTEAKEAILGFAVIDAGSWDEALEVAKRFRAIVGDGQSTLHQMFGP